MDVLDYSKFTFPYKGSIVSWTPLEIHGDRVLCCTDCGVKALFNPEMIRRIKLLDSLSKRMQKKMNGTVHVKSKDVQVGVIFDRVIS